MATVTLHRAGRLQQQIREAIRATDLDGRTAVSIFATDPAAEVERLAAGLQARLDRVERLLDTLAALRAAVGQANAESGISALLAEKAGIEEWISLAAKLREEDPVVAYRKLRSTSQCVDRGAVAEQAAAMRARYGAAEQAVATISVELVDEADGTALDDRIAAKRRRLERIADELRALNGSVEVTIADEALAWLEQERVV